MAKLQIYVEMRPRNSILLYEVLKGFKMPLWYRSPNVIIPFSNQSFQQKGDLSKHNFGFSQVLDETFRYVSILNIWAILVHIKFKRAIIGCAFFSLANFIEIFCKSSNGVRIACSIQYQGEALSGESAQWARWLRLKE